VRNSAKSSAAFSVERVCVTVWKDCIFYDVADVCLYIHENKVCILCVSLPYLPTFPGFFVFEVGKIFYRYR